MVRLAGRTRTLSQSASVMTPAREPSNSNTVAHTPFKSERRVSPWMATRMFFERGCVAAMVDGCTCGVKSQNPQSRAKQLGEMCQIHPGQERKI